jgi:predicted RNA binding protein YcfA (HicA-like mRNA interferase family)
VSKQSKLLARLLSIPVDFTWDELVSVVGKLGFSENSDKGGSYRTFVNSEGRKLFLHEPHPNKVLKKYAIRKVIDTLNEYGLLPKK